MRMQQLHKKRAAQSPSSPLACSTPQCCCYTCCLIRFLLSTLAPSALGVLLHHLFRAHARWAYCYLVTCCEPFLHGLHPHALTLVLLLLGSCHTSSLCCGHPPHTHMQGGFGASGGIRTHTPKWITDFKSVASTIPPRSQRWPAQRDSNSRPCA